MIENTGPLDRRIILLSSIVKNNNNIIINKNYSVRSWFEIYLENLTNIWSFLVDILKITGNFNEEYRDAIDDQRDNNSKIWLKHNYYENDKFFE